MDAEHTISRFDLMAEIDRAKGINSREILLFPSLRCFEILALAFLLLYQALLSSIVQVPITARNLFLDFGTSKRVSDR